VVLGGDRSRCPGRVDDEQVEAACDATYVVGASGGLASDSAESCGHHGYDARGSPPATPRGPRDHVGEPGPGLTLGSPPDALRIAGEGPGQVTTCDEILFVVSGGRPLRREAVTISQKSPRQQTNLQSGSGHEIFKSLATIGRVRAC
jgi:hypothetical protein